MMLEGKPLAWESNLQNYSTRHLRLDSNFVAGFIHRWGDPENVQGHRYVDEQSGFGKVPSRANPRCR